MTADTPQPPMFDTVVCEKIRTAFHAILLEHPEVKCLAASITWNGALNDASIMHGVWVGANGPINRADEIFPSIDQTWKLLGVQTERAMEFNTALQEQLRVLAGEVTKAKEAQVSQAATPEAEPAAGRA